MFNHLMFRSRFILGTKRGALSGDLFSQANSIKIIANVKASEAQPTTFQNATLPKPLELFSVLKEVKRSTNKLFCRKLNKVLRTCGNCP